MSIEFRYLGGPTFYITSEKGTKILIDPCITGVPDHGMPPLPVDLDDVSDVDLILISHGAIDHMKDTLELTNRSNCKVMCGIEVAYHLQRQGLAKDRVLLMGYGALRPFKGLSVRCVESKHCSFLHTPDYVVTGVPLGFIIYTEYNCGIYHPGDTSIFSDMKLFAELYHPEIGLLPVGIGAPFAFAELTPKEAAIVANWMNLKMAIPMHYPSGGKEGLDFAEFARHDAPSTRVIVLEQGQSLSYVTLS